MHIQHPDAKLQRGGAYGAGHGVRNVMKFEVEEDVEAALADILHQGGTAVGEQLLAYFHPAIVGVEPFQQAQNFLFRGEIERDDYALAVFFIDEHRLIAGLEFFDFLPGRGQLPGQFPEPAVSPESLEQSQAEQESQGAADDERAENPDRDGLRRQPPVAQAYRYRSVVVPGESHRGDKYANYEESGQQSLQCAHK